MNEADKAIGAIRSVHHHISTGHRHDVAKYPVSLRTEEKQHAAPNRA